MPGAASTTPPGLGAGTDTVRSIGPRRRELLTRLGVANLGDALLFVPRRYEDRRRLTAVGELDEGMRTTVRGRVRSARVLFLRGRPPAFRAQVEDGGDVLTATWFHFRAAHLRDLLRPGRGVCLYGAVRRGKRGGWEMTHPEVEAAGDDRCPGTVVEGILPVYPATEGISPRMMRTLMGEIIRAALPHVTETLPDEVRRRHDLAGLRRSVREVHLPQSGAALDALNEQRSEGHRRLKFEELYRLQVHLACRRARRLSEPSARRMVPRGGLERRLRERLPFALTGGQEAAWSEISRDMASPFPMRRLLQGDVGSGKTLVAVLAALLAVENGAQAAFMAPTEILAEQHFLTLEGLLPPLGVRCDLLTGSRTGAERERLLSRTLGGETHLVVGTHALVQQPVRFRRLGLAIVDEQHRFGAEQRRSLGKKGNRPHLLAMTATPIPRTMALTAYGDMDLSVIDRLPPGRRPVRTEVRPARERRRVYAAAAAVLARGARGFVVCPAVEEGERPVRSTGELAVELRERLLPGVRIGILHGRMPLPEREAVIDRFRRGALTLLVATTVVEVGIDIPEATLMIVEHAERFGLAQLHQLRGRVGRGAEPGRCVLLHAGRLTDEARRRLGVMAGTTDGFRIAEADLLLRGPGDFFGSRQSGEPRLRVADLARDGRILELARKEAWRSHGRPPAVRS